MVYDIIGFVVLSIMFIAYVFDYDDTRQWIIEAFVGVAYFMFLLWIGFQIFG